MSERHYGRLRFTVGFFYFGTVREFLKKCQFIQGMKIEWMEGSGLLSREYIVKGYEDDLMSIKHSLLKWSNS